MFNPYRSSAQSSSTAPNLPITSNNPITPSTDSIPIRFPVSPVLGACLSFHTVQSGDSCKYSCTSCDKVFSTTQALGGHQNAHRKERNALFAREQQRSAEENDRDRDVVLSPDPVRWAYPAGYYYVDAEIMTTTTTSAVNTNNKMCEYEFFHFMGMAGDCNPKQAGFGFGSSSSGGHGGASGSGTKRPPEGDGDGADQKKKAKYYEEDDDLKVVMPSMNLSLATRCGGDDLIDEIEGSDSDLEWEDGEYIYFNQGGGASTSKTEELDLSLKL
ncbi:hypothetical protein PRUPE_7G082300 [Prunus persica]|uniref:Uncharacterized protein n=1 Tax=Prunus persica TaxID=3760 RepID=M5VTM9_PRUPE|nr:uncharacterized protein LOC18769515 [Prunus persica]ONH95641.1 hypothetical protein PRUPE_7G082300 [Prunus persica]